MTELYKQWSHVSCYILCSYYGDCDFCKKVYKADICPKEYAFKSNNYEAKMERDIRFVKYITDRLYELEEDKLPFDISDMDLVNILEDYDDSE